MMERDKILELMKAHPVNAKPWKHALTPSRLIVG